MGPVPESRCTAHFYDTGEVSFLQSPIGDSRDAHVFGNVNRSAMGHTCRADLRDSVDANATSDARPGSELSPRISGTHPRPGSGTITEGGPTHGIRSQAPGLFGTFSACLGDANPADSTVQAPSDVAQVQDRVDIDEHLSQRKPSDDAPLSGYCGKRNTRHA
jgi:hypothetical protein